MRFLLSRFFIKVKQFNINKSTNPNKLKSTFWLINEFKFSISSLSSLHFMLSCTKSSFLFLQNHFQLAIIKWVLIKCVIIPKFNFENTYFLVVGGFGPGKLLLPFLELQLERHGLGSRVKLKILEPNQIYQHFIIPILLEWLNLLSNRFLVSKWSAAIRATFASHCLVPLAAFDSNICKNWTTKWVTFFMRWSWCSKLSMTCLSLLLLMECRKLVFRSRSEGDSWPARLSFKSFRSLIKIENQSLYFSAY